MRKVFGSSFPVIKHLVKRVNVCLALLFYSSLIHVHLEHLEKANKHEEDKLLDSQLMPFPPGKLDSL